MLFVSLITAGALSACNSGTNTNGLSTQTTAATMSKINTVSAATYTLNLVNNSLADVNLVAAGNTVATINANSNYQTTLSTDTVYNLQTAKPAQILGTLQQNTSYYSLQATPQAYLPGTWEDISVSYTSTANSTSGGYNTMLSSASAVSPTFQSSCAQDQGSIGVVCNLSANGGSVAGSTITVNLSGGFAPPVTPVTPTPELTPGGMWVANYGSWTAQNYDAIWYPNTVYPEVQYNGVNYVACGSATADQIPGAATWTPWVVFDSSSTALPCK